MIKLVVFDWNGTLIADTAAIVKTTNIIFERLDREKVDIRFLRENFVLPISSFYQVLGYDQKEVLEVANQHGQIFHPNYERLIKAVRTRSGAKRVLEYLKDKKIKTVIFSNHVLEKIHPHLKRLKLEDYIDLVVANDSGMTTVREKNKEVKIKGFLKEQGINNNEVIIVGDSLEEIEIGRALGIKSVAIKYGNYSTKRLREAKPDYLINSLGELIPIIEALSEARSTPKITETTKIA